MSSELEDHLGLEGMADPYEKVELEPRSLHKDSLGRLRAKEEGVRFLPFFWAGDSSKVLWRTTVIDLEKRKVLDLRYKAYQELDSSRVPSDIRAKVRSPKGISTFEIGISDPEGSDSLSYPFRIPDGYAPIRP